ncbi:MAG: hypothetical protein ABSC00_03450 [Acidimicrobiales bacterium]
MLDTIRGEKSLELTTAGGNRNTMSDTTLLTGQVDGRVDDAVAHLVHVRKEVEDSHDHLLRMARDMIRGGPEFRVSRSVRTSR